MPQNDLFWSIRGPDWKHKDTSLWGFPGLKVCPQQLGPGGEKTSFQSKFFLKKIFFHMSYFQSGKCSWTSADAPECRLKGGRSAKARSWNLGGGRGD